MTTKRKKSESNRACDIPLHVMLTAVERDAIDRIAFERKLSLRDLVVSAVLNSQPSNTLQRLLDLEARVLLLEAAVKDSQR